MGFTSGFPAVVRRWLLALGVAVLAIASSAIFSASAQALAKPIDVTIHNRTNHTITIGPFGEHDVSPGRTGAQFDTDSSHLFAYAFRPVYGTLRVSHYCGEFKFVNPVLGYPYAELLREPRHPEKGVQSEFRFAVGEEHTFSYQGRKLAVKRTPDEHVGGSISKTFKRFQVYVESC